MKFDNKILAVSLWIPPGVIMARAVDTSLGKSPTHARPVLNELYDYVRATTSTSKSYWELLDFAPMENESIELLTEVFSPVFSMADKGKTPVYYFTSDQKRIDILSKWKFEVSATTNIGINKYPVYSLMRAPV